MITINDLFIAAMFAAFLFTFLIFCKRTERDGKMEIERMRNMGRNRQKDVKSSGKRIQSLSMLASKSNHKRTNEK